MSNAIASDLSKPMPLPTLENELKDFTDPEAIADCRDPLRRVAMIMVALSKAEADALEMQVDEMKDDTDAIAELNAVMRLLNDASATVKTAESTTMALVLLSNKDLGDEAESFKFNSEVILALQRRLNDAGIKDEQMAVAKIDPFSGELRMSKANLEAATKNLQTRIEDVSNTTQQKQLFMQTLMGKYNGTFEVATAGLKKMTEITEAILQNLKR